MRFTALLLIRLNAAINHRILQRRCQKTVRRRRHPSQQKNQSDVTTNERHGMKINPRPTKIKLKYYFPLGLSGLGIFAPVSLSQADNF